MFSKKVLIEIGVKLIKKDVSRQNDQLQKLYIEGSYHHPNLGFGAKNWVKCPKNGQNCPNDTENSDLGPKIETNVLKITKNGQNCQNSVLGPKIETNVLKMAKIAQMSQKTRIWGQKLRQMTKKWPKLPKCHRKLGFEAKNWS